MSERKYANIFHDAGNFRACIVSDHETVWHTGISERNIGELVKAITNLGYHVTLYTLHNPQYFAETNEKNNERQVQA